MKRNVQVLLAALVFACISCKQEEVQPIDAYVVMVSLDGFRWDYPELYSTPGLMKIEKNGVRAEKLIPSFPTKTFPNHYTLATGLYPDHHGIINNSFYASELGGIYRIGDRSMVMNPDAYFGEPIWVTAEKQGLTAASFFWVGSEAAISGIRPTYWEKYDGSIRYEDRIDQVIKWLKLPEGKRPSLITLYFDEPDGVGHDFGPEHEETGQMVSYLDELVAELRERLALLEYGDRVNLIVLSDHGMGEISQDRYLNLTDHMNQDWKDHLIGGNPVYLIDPADGFRDSILNSLNALQGVSAYSSSTMPEHLHYGTSARFPGIVAVADSLWSIGTNSDPSGYSGGAHGYGQDFSQMHAIFYAEGPAFKNNYTVPAFSNVEVYNIIAHILGLDPAPNDGDLSRVQDIFK